jgi:Ca2+-binding RTX toxin-like protein
MSRASRVSVVVASCLTAVLVPATAAAAYSDIGLVGDRGNGGRTGECRGEVAQIIGVPIWHGTAERDVVVASAATVDEVWGEGGDDLICVFNPSREIDGVVVHGGIGDDTVLTYNGHNEVYGEDGDDIIYLNGGGEYVQGGDGADHVWALGTTNGLWALGGPGADILQGGQFEDVLNGDEGNDILIGAGGEDVLFGGVGDDQLLSGHGPDDYLDGEAGDDSCSGESDTTFLNCETATGGGQLPIGT